MRFWRRARDPTGMKTLGLVSEDECQGIILVEVDGGFILTIKVQEGAAIELNGERLTAPDSLMCPAGTIPLFPEPKWLLWTLSAGMAMPVSQPHIMTYSFRSDGVTAVTQDGRTTVDIIERCGGGFSIKTETKTESYITLNGRRVTGPPPKLPRLPPDSQRFLGWLYGKVPSAALLRHSSVANLRLPGLFGGVLTTVNPSGKL